MTSLGAAGQSWEVQGYAAGVKFVATLILLLLEVISLKSPRFLHLQRSSHLSCFQATGEGQVVLHRVAYKRSCLALPCCACFPAGGVATMLLLEVISLKPQLFPAVGQCYTESYWWLTSGAALLCFALLCLFS